jgi:digeranylgeranylglycerophospholipid reductase
MDISYMINKHIASYSDEQWDSAFDLLKRLTPAQMAQAMRGEYSASLVMGIIARNPLMVATGGKRFLDLMLERINKPALLPAEG